MNKETKETTTSKTCKVCGTEYRRTYCDYCKRKARWNPDKYISGFTPRLQAALKDIKIKVAPSDIAALKEGLGLYIVGMVGCGKTLYAANLMIASIKSRYINQDGPRTHSFITTIDLLEKIKASYDAEEKTIDVMQIYSEVDFLVLDDFGTSKLTEWSLEKLSQLINYRYEYLKPTIITSNLDLDKLEEVLGDGRIPSRIFQMTRTKKMRATDYRLK